MKKQAYFFDIDGTLYDNQFHQISDGLLEEFDALRQQGDDIYLMSSRSPYEAVHLPKSFIDYPYAGIILEGGAAIYDGVSKKLIDARLIPNEDVRRVHRFCRDHHLLWRYSGPDGNYFNSEPDDSTRLHWRRLYLIAPPAREWKGDDVCNLLIWTADPALQQEIQALLPDSSLVLYPDCIEVRARGISKESTVQHLKTGRGYQTVICAGDGPNDVEMLRQADYGVAVGNACREAREAADEVIGSVGTGGVSTWLNERRTKGNRRYV